MPEETNAQTLWAAARATVDAVRDCFLITTGADGAPRARVVRRFDPADDLTLCFGISPASRKTAEIRARPRVCVAFQDLSEDAYVEMTGTARLIDDPATRRRYWDPSWTRFFPQGPDAGYLIAAFAPDRIEVANLARGITGQPPDLKPPALVRAGDDWRLTGE